MPPLTRFKRPGGFTLVEVLLATVILSFGMAGLLGLLMFSQRVKMQTEAQRQAVMAAHHRCVLFAKGMIYPDALDLGSPATNVLVPSDLPGGFPVTRVSEVVTPAVDGSSATIEVTYQVATLRLGDVTVTEIGTRVR